MRQPADEGAVNTFPHVRANRRLGYVDIDATVVNRDAGWLELLACLPGTRTHESILAVEAMPSHIHLALVMVGLEPGAPMTWDLQGQKLVAKPARGPQVAVSIVTTVDGKAVETPANQWVIDRGTGSPMVGDWWIFTGSVIGEAGIDPDQQGDTGYHADSSGTVISIVHFGDDVLARDTQATQHSDAQGWGPNTQLIPPVDTEVVIRLRPVKADHVGDGPTPTDGGP